MKILSRQELSTGKVFVDLILTEEEVKRLVAGQVVNGELPELAIQIVGYGEEEIEELRKEVKDNANMGNCHKREIRDGHDNR